MIPVLTPKAEGTLMATFAPLPPPCGASLRTIDIDRERITLRYDHPSFELPIVHPDASQEGLRVGPYRLLDTPTPACPGAVSALAASLEGRQLEDPWQMLPGPRVDEPRGRWSDPLPEGVREAAGATILLVHVVVVALLARAALRARGGRQRLWQAAPLGAACVGWLVRALAPAAVFNWYSITPDSPTPGVLVAEGFVGFQELARRLQVPGAGFDHVVALVALSGGLASGLAVPFAEKMGFSRRAALAAGILMALSPALVRMGSSDAQHPIALTLWMAFCLAWERARAGGWRPALACVVAGILVPLVRSEAGLWLLAALVLFPPRRASWRTTAPALAIALGVTASLALRALRPGHELGGGSAVTWALLPLTSWTGISRAPEVTATLVVLGALVMVTTDRGLALRWALAALVVGAPVLLTRHPDVSDLTIRYFLPLALLTELAVAATVARLGELLGRRLAFAPLVAAVLACALEARAWLAEDSQYVFRREATFLRSAIHHLPRDARVCMLDPAMNHDWPGKHSDFDSAWSPRGGGQYAGLGRPIAVVGDERPDKGGCDYYYETAGCFFEDDDPRFVGDIAHLRTLCAAWREHVEPEPASEAWVAAVSFGARFDDVRVPLRVFRVR